MLKLTESPSEENPKSLEAVIETKQLLLFSANHHSRNQVSDISNLCNLYADATNMKSYASGKPIAAEIITARHKERIARWNAGNPFSAFIVENKQGKFVGHVVFGASGKPGTAEIGIVIDNPFWRKGYGTEVIEALTYEYAPFLAEKGYKLADEPLSTVYATAHPDNGTTKIFNRLGYKLDETIEHADYGATRNVFSHMVVKPELELKADAPRPRP